jgi:hypothetical protein
VRERTRPLIERTELLSRSLFESRREAFILRARIETLSTSRFFLFLSRLCFAALFLSCVIVSPSIVRVERRDMAPTIKWTSKAENGRKFRGKPRDTEETALRRQFKKPRRTGEKTILQTDALEGREEVQVETAEVVIEVEETAEVAIEVVGVSDGSEDNIPFSELKEKIVAEKEGIDSDEDYTQLPDTNEKRTPKLGLLGIGTEVMRQFDEGLLVGTVQSYDRKESLYKILYSDGDMEDMDEEEYVYAYQLALANGGDANNLSSRDSADEESAYQLPKKKVNFIFVLHLLCLNLRLSSSSKPKRHECEVRSELRSHVSKSWMYVSLTRVITYTRRTSNLAFQ